jgi:hypothetical protein
VLKDTDSEENWEFYTAEYSQEWCCLNYKTEIR